MTSLPFFIGAPPSSRVFRARATKGATTTREEKGFMDWLLGNLTKEDQFFETDPILQKVEGKPGSTNGRKTGTVEFPSKKKNGGFGGLFVKKE